MNGEGKRGESAIPSTCTLPSPGMPVRFLVFDDPPRVQYCIAVQQGGATHSYAVPEEDYTFQAALSVFQRPASPRPAPVPPPESQHTEVDISAEDPYATFGPGHAGAYEENEEESEEGDATGDDRAEGQSTRMYDGTEDMDIMDSRLHGEPRADPTSRSGRSLSSLSQASSLRRPKTLRRSPNSAHSTFNTLNPAPSRSLHDSRHNQPSSDRRTCRCSRSALHLASIGTNGISCALMLSAGY